MIEELNYYGPNRVSNSMIRHFIQIPYENSPLSSDEQWRIQGGCLEVMAPYVYVVPYNRTD